jgi:xylan 1,4-beta-xylosidase
LAYHYCHYDKLYLKQYAANSGDRYCVFTQKSDVALRLSLENMPIGEYETEYYSVSRQSGSSFDAWVTMGMPSQLRPTLREYLKDISKPFYSLARQSTATGKLNVEMRLRPHHVLLAIVSRIQ